MQIIGWQLWYEDGQVVTSEDMDWDMAPEHGIQVLILHYPKGYRDIFHTQDFYVLPGNRRYKHGTLIEAARFLAMVDQAMKDRWRPHG